MTDKTRIPLAEARTLAQELMRLLEPWCERIEIAGSIRRRRPDPSDIEIVCIAREHQVVTSVDLFGAVAPLMESELEPVLTCLVVRGLLGVRLDRNDRRAWGRRYKRATWRGFPLDLFVTTESQWGSIFLIRTGPKSLSNALVTQSNKYTAEGHYRGLLPPWAEMRDGKIRHIKTHEESWPMPEEDDLFTFLGIPYVEPENREAWIEERKAKYESRSGTITPR